jgi:aerobic carbon-monoxide dehydrogenase large subunit
MWDAKSLRRIWAASVVNQLDAQAPDAPQIHGVAPKIVIFQWHLGDPVAIDTAFKSANHVTRLDLTNNRLIPNAMEPRAALAEFDSGTDSLTLWTTSQNPHVARLVLTAFIGIAPEHKLRVIAPDVGGASRFGNKGRLQCFDVVWKCAKPRIHATIES